MKKAIHFKLTVYEKEYTGLREEAFDERSIISLLDHLLGSANLKFKLESSNSFFNSILRKIK